MSSLLQQQLGAKSGAAAAGNGRDVSGPDRLPTAELRAQQRWGIAAWGMSVLETGCGELRHRILERQHLRRCPAAPGSANL